MTLKIGDKAPDTLGVNQDGRKIRISDFKGKKLIVYFYPKDNTSGCTAEACSFRDNYALLREAGYQVIGISKDSINSHLKFIEKEKLPFDLIADTETELALEFGVWGKKKLYGKEYMGMFRTTFIIDEKGLITDIFTQKEIKNKEHAEQILARISKLD